MKYLILLAILASLAIGQEYGEVEYKQMTCWESEGNDTASDSQERENCE